MKVFGVTVWRSKAAVGVTEDPNGAFGPPTSRSGDVTSNVGPQGWRRVLESFAGAWQRNIEVDSPQQLLAFSAVYACLRLISADISKLRIKLVSQDANGIWNEIQNAAFSPVLRKPNAYQTRIQFLSAWILSKLMYGNTYVLKQRDGSSRVSAMHVLDPQRVNVLVTADGSVWYRLKRDDLSRVIGDIAIPASEIIHDRGPCFFHPLVGIAPIFACALAATQGNRIQRNSQEFFNNLSRPGGVLSAPEEISPETEKALKDTFEREFSGANIGRLLVVGDDMKFTPMSIPAQQAQLIEQLNWTAVDVGRAFQVPLHKLMTGPNPTYNNIGALNQDYYGQTLQEHIESIELLLDEGLGLVNVPGVTYGTELDLDGLLRMDPSTMADVLGKQVKDGYVAPNEARSRINLKPVAGGEEPIMQQQNFPLSVLAKQPPPGATPAPAPAPAPTDPAAAGGDGPNANGAAPAKALETMFTRIQDANAIAESERAAATAQMQTLLELARGAAEHQQRQAEQAALEAERAAELKAATLAAEAEMLEFVDSLTLRFNAELVCV